MGMKPGRWALQTERWKRVRRLALIRDGYQCQKCGYRMNLEVHHLKRVADHPKLAFDLSNLMTLCRTCHTDETNKELGHTPDPARRAWRNAVAELAKPNRAERSSNA